MGAAKFFARSCRAWFLLVALIAGSAQATVGPESRKIHFAGVAFTGEAAGASTFLPHAHAALDNKGVAELNRRLSRALSENAPRHFTLDMVDLASLDATGSSTVLALSLDRETVSSERIAGRYKVLYELAAQALFFDLRERQVLFAYPITLQQIELLEAPPSSHAVAAIADRAIFGSEATSLPMAFAAELTGLRLPSDASRRIQVVDVRWAEGVAERLPPAQRDRDLIGHEFTKILAAHLQLPLLPHAMGQAVGGAIPARFADGKAFNLTIPEPDYRMTLEVSDFRDKTVRETPAFRQQLYGAYFQVRVDEPLSSTVFFDQPLRQGAIKTIPASQERVDASAANYETLLAGFSSFAQASAGKSLPWTGEQTGGREFKKQLDAFQELITQCR